MLIIKTISELNLEKQQKGLFWKNSEIRNSEIKNSEIEIFIVKQIMYG